MKGCTHIYAPAGGARAVRLDTGDTILTRDLLPSERQPSLIPEPPTPGPASPPEPESASEPDRCIECGEPVTTSAAETCPGEGDLCDGGVLHPGCVREHQAAHVPLETDDEDEDEYPDDATPDDEAGE